MLFQNQISMRPTSAPKHYFELNAKDSGSDVEFLTRFVFEIYVVAMASTSRTQISFEIIFEETLKDYEMLIEEEYKRSESDVEFITRFVFKIYVVAMASMSRIQILL